ncbi:hypothetical protein DFH07DRAFT_538273 [Mycena maculata]|uniref:C3H1-type domain-containing protein n=1 Tax=Mycena maculata TaxID=230809 RepID=A0AAD7K826_9AGAR|nr:hypothetical protein DFH07DRAFT_538273 [Mycena maculata]
MFQFRAKKQCAFFQEGRCRYGDECRFLHSPISTTPRPPILPIFHSANPASGSSLPNTTRTFSMTPPPAPRSGTRAYEPGAKDASFKLVQAINALRVSAGQEELERTNKFFEILEVAVCRLEEDEFEAATDALREVFTFDYHSKRDSQDGSDYGRSDSDDEDFGDMDLFSPLKKSNPEYREPTFSAR